MTAVDWKTAAVVGVFVLVAYYVVSRDAVAVAGKVGEFVSDPQNPVNQTAEGAYKDITGSNQNMGADFYDLHHNPDGSIKGGALAHWDIWLLDKVTNALQ